jgi:hypothetical protein
MRALDALLDHVERRLRRSTTGCACLVAPDVAGLANHRIPGSHHDSECPMSGKT